MEKTGKSGEQMGRPAHLTGGQRNPNRKDRLLEKERYRLAERLKRGSREAATELVDTYYERIYLYLRRLGHNHQVSEDLTQEAFFAAWQHTGQLRNGKALNSWLYRIAGNLSRRYWRRHKGRDTVGIDYFEISQGNNTETDKAAHLEQLGQLNNAVAKLPLKLRQTLVLHYMQQMTIVEAAQAAGVREGTFKSRLNRALKMLRKQVV